MISVNRKWILPLAFSALATAQAPPPPPNNGGLQPLRRARVPRPANLEKYVRDERALTALGKALFWDMQLGSDGRTACASCHFHAGADHRLQNQIADPNAAFTPNTILSVASFPFHKLTDINDNRSAASRTSHRAGSAGVFRRLLTAVTPGSAMDDGYDLADASFSLAGANVRQVTARNAPSVIDAVFNFRNFWDGRASNIFTGLTPFGDADTRANALLLDGGKLVPEMVRLDNSSLASQAVGPVLNSVEMAYEGRTWRQAGRRMLPRRALALQRVAPTDNVLGAYTDGAGRGLNTTYARLVQVAFRPEYWSATETTADKYTQAESNFSLFFGLAVQAYEATLISGQTRYDSFLDGDTTALTPQEQDGLQLFRGRAACATCHGGAETTGASVANSLRAGQVAGRNPGLDTGFFRTGVTPASEDNGLGGKDDFGNLLSLAARRNSNARAEGAFKAPALRNVEFTGPYFHNGGQSTLEQVIDFYSRGGDFPQNGPGGLRRLNLNAGERASLVALMKAMSDQRVRFSRAPFDHPELCVPHGAAESAPGVLRKSGDPRFSLSALDNWSALPAVGAEGTTAPLQTFAEMLEGAGNDGSRAHSLADVCTAPLP